jgi:hypothetical protein
MITGVAGRQPVDSRLNPDPATQVAQTAKPLIENFGGTNIQHAEL